MTNEFEKLSLDLFKKSTTELKSPEKVVGGIHVSCDTATNCTHFDSDTYNAQTKQVTEDKGHLIGDDC